MSKEFRQRGISEYLQMLWRHKAAILLPTLAVGLSVGYVVWKLPSMYESKSLLKVDPPSISDRAVQSLTDVDVSQRLSSISEEVKSRSSLEPMITKFALFERERQSVPMELLVEQMRKNITIEVLNKEQDQKFTNFSVAYKDLEPDKARAVTAELAGKYIREQQEKVIQNSRETREFFEKQLAEVKTKLDAIDKQRLEYMSQNLDKLPSSTQGLIAQLEGYRGQEKTIETEIGRMRDQSAYLAREQNNLREYSEKEATQQATVSSDIRRTPAYAELVKKRADLEAQLKNLKSQYREAHPDVIAKKNEIEQVNKEIADLQQQAKNSVEEIRRSSAGSVELRIKNYDNERQRIEGEIARQTGTLEKIRLSIGDIQRRLESVPTAEVTLGSFEREYQNTKQSYDDLLKKKNDADLQAGRDIENKGETIGIVDPANTPQSPVNATKRYTMMGLGVGIGFGLGLLFAFLLEFPRFLTINNLDDAAHYTSLPVLAAVPDLVTMREARWQRGVGFFKLMAGMAVAAASIPLLIIALQYLRLFDRFVS